MPTTSYKWFPGHYVLIYGGKADPDGGLGRLLDQLDAFPNLIGVQKRYAWKDIENTKDNYYGADGNGGIKEILRDLETCKAHGKYLRPFITFKGFNGGRGAPNYLRPGQAGYEAGFGDGVYNWPTGTTRNEHPCLWLPAIKARFIKLFQVLGQQLDSKGYPATDPRWWLSMVDVNETSWGTVPAGTGTDTAVARQKLMLQAFKEMYAAWKAAAPTTLLCHFLNYPNNATFSVLNGTPDAPTIGLPAAMQSIGCIAIGGPDNWLGDDDLVGTATRPGVLKHYDNLRGLLPISPSNQEADYEYKSAKDQRADDDSEGGTDTSVNNITIQALYDRATTKSVIYPPPPASGGVERFPSHGTHITWAARTEEIGTFGRNPWNEVKDFFSKLWNTPGTPEYRNKTPGIDATPEGIPLLIQDSAPPTPTGISVVLTSDTGELNNDKITNNAAVSVIGAAVTATIEYSTLTVGPWSTTRPAAVEGKNTLYVRQRVSGVPSDASDPLEFTLDTTKPTVLRTTVDAELVRVTFTDALPLSEVDPFRADKSCFRVTINGVAANVFGRFVSGPLKYYRLEMTPAAVAGDVVKVSYTQPTTGTARIQDSAGNYADNFTDLLCNNVTGLPNPTTTATVTKIGGVAPGGYTPQDAVLIEGTLSAPLAGYEELEVRKKSTAVNEAGETVDVWVLLGAATVTGTTWTFQEGHRNDGTYTWTARVRNGEKLGAYAPDATITIDTDPPNPPYIANAAYRVGSPFVVTGNWSGASDETLKVVVAGTTYTSSNGLAITGGAWSLSLPSKPVGRYNVTATVTDLAGNATSNDDPGFVDVYPLPSINELRLAFAKRA
jgi:hypothetical protein